VAVATHHGRHADHSTLPEINGSTIHGTPGPVKKFRAPQSSFTTSHTRPPVGSPLGATINRAKCRRHARRMGVINAHVTHYPQIPQPTAADGLHLRSTLHLLRVGGSTTDQLQRALHRLHVGGPATGQLQRALHRLHVGGPATGQLQRTLHRHEVGGAGGGESVEVRQLAL